MFATIQMSPYVLVQGVLKKRLPGGAIAVQCEGRVYVGRPVNGPPAPPRVRSVAEPA
jgi:hypothetical protein